MHFVVKFIKQISQDMIQKAIKILHTADIQIEVRGMHQRFKEFTHILSEIQKKISEEQPDIYLIAGDIFENWNANDTERQIFQQHLHDVLSQTKVKQIVITYGNHDVNQRKTTNFFRNGDDDEATPNAIDTIVSAINDSRILLLSHTGVYNSGVIDELQFVNWSQKAKHSDVLNESYAPDYTQCNPTSTCITIFHDPIQLCKSWDGLDLRGSQKCNAIDVFETKTILAGDIHIPQIIKKDDKTFIYCGSPVPRNFGEGDYYEDGKLFQKSMNRHTISVCTLEPNGTLSNQYFIAIPQYRSYSTFLVTPKPEAKTLPELNWVIENKATENFVRVKLPSASESYIEQEAFISKAILDSNPTAFTKVEFSYGKAFDSIENEETSLDNVHQLISSEKIIEVANDYIDKIVANTRTVPVDDKAKVAGIIKKLFSKEIDNLSTDIISNNIKLDSIIISNFMSLGDEVKIDFRNVNDLIKLTGGNGIGKTTFYNAIKFAITGYISSSQNKVKKNANNLMYFNDYRWNIDEVLVDLKYTLNNKQYIARRAISRTWKKDVTTEQKSSKLWKNYIDSTTSTLHLIEKDGSTEKNEVAQKLLDDIFGGLDNLCRIVFPNQFTLRSFVCTDSVTLCEEVLHHIGMGFFDTMSDRYSQLKDDVLKNIEKPADDIDTIIKAIASVSAEIVSYEDAIEVNTEKLKVVTDEIAKEQTIIDDLNKKLIPNIDENKQKKNQELIELQTSVATAKQKNEEASKIINSKLEEFEKQDIVTSISNTENKQSVTQNSLDSHQQEFIEMQQRFNEVTLSIAEVEKQIKEHFDKKKNDIVSKISSKDNEIATCQSELDKLKNKYIETRDILKKEYLDNVNARAIEIQKMKHDAEMLEAEKKNLSNELATLENSKACPTCGRQYDQNTVETIQDKIKTIGLSIDNINTKIQDKNDEISKAEQLHETSVNATEWPELDTIKTEVLSKNDEKKELEKEKLSLNQTYNNIEFEIDAAIKTSKEIAALNVKKNEIANLIETRKTVIANEKKELDMIASKLSELRTKQSEYHTAQLQQQKLQLLIEQTKHDESKIDLIKHELVELDIQASKNKEVFDEIEKHAYEMNLIKKDEQHILDDINTLTSDKEVAKDRKSRLNEQKDAAIRYRIVSTSIKLYKQLIGKNGLPQHIFSMVRPLLNKNLNNLLEDMDFRLAFTDTNQLVMIDLSKPGQPIRSPHQLSGMQTCFTGLALIYVNRMCNNVFMFDHLFIDEVSGQLNSGEDLTYESNNYQAQLKKLLRKFTGLKVWVVDHVIDDMEETHRFEVMPSSDGATIKQLS